MIETDMEFSSWGAQEQPSLESESETIVGAKREYTQQQLEKLPEELMTLSAHSIASMTTLSLTRNRFLTLPSALYIFTSLRVLDLSRNKLLGLPTGISALSQLEELNLLSNNSRLSALPLNELTAMSQLRVLDLRYNQKCEKEEASKTLRSLFGLRLLLTDPKTRPRYPAAESACYRDGSVLADQLAPWSTPHLRTRLKNSFGVDVDPELVGRAGIMQHLLEQYTARGPRMVRQARGIPVDPVLVAALTASLRSLVWPTTTRERPAVRADKYFTLQRPMTRFTVEEGTKARLNAAKLVRYAELWELINKAIEGVDPEYAAKYTGVAVTKGFRDSPHIDTENIGPFYGLALGDFSGGGAVAVESSPWEVTHVDTFQRLGQVDGRYPHWVTGYTGERFSIIYYQTVGSVTPMGPAVPM